MARDPLAGYELLNLHGNVLSTLRCSLVAPGITELNVSSNAVGCLDGGALAAAFPRLRSLDMSSCGVRDGCGLAALTSLTRLVLRYNKLASLEWLDAAAGAATPLASLDLRRNRLRGLGALAPLGHMTALTDLSLRGLNASDPNPVCSEGGYVAAVLRACGRQLRVLDCSPVAALTPFFDVASRNFRRRADGSSGGGGGGDDGGEDRGGGGGGGGGGVAAGRRAARADVRAPLAASPGAGARDAERPRRVVVQEVHGGVDAWAAHGSCPEPAAGSSASPPRRPRVLPLPPPPSSPEWPEPPRAAAVDAAGVGAASLRAVVHAETQSSFDAAAAGAPLREALASAAAAAAADRAVLEARAAELGAALEAARAQLAEAAVRAAAVAAEREAAAAEAASAREGAAAAAAEAALAREGAAAAAAEARDAAALARSREEARTAAVAALGAAVEDGARLRAGAAAAGEDATRAQRRCDEAAAAAAANADAATAVRTAAHEAARASASETIASLREQVRARCCMRRPPVRPPFITAWRRRCESRPRRPSLRARVRPRRSPRRARHAMN